MQFSLVGAHIKIYANNKLLKEVQSLNFTIDYGETAIRGIDSPWPQEIAGGAITISGTLQLMRQKNSNGIQEKNMRPSFKDQASSPYISLRVENKATNTDIMYFPMAKVVSESHQAAAKGRYLVTVNFTAILPLSALDRST